MNATDPKQIVWGANNIAIVAGRVDENGKPIAAYYFANKLLEAGAASKVGRLIASTPEKIRNYVLNERPPRA
jgi:hypothetical protein